MGEDVSKIDNGLSGIVILGIYSGLVNILKDNGIEKHKDAFLKCMNGYSIEESAYFSGFSAHEFQGWMEKVFINPVNLMGFIDGEYDYTVSLEKGHLIFTQNELQETDSTHGVGSGVATDIGVALGLTGSVEERKANLDEQYLDIFYTDDNDYAPQGNELSDEEFETFLDHILMMFKKSSDNDNMKKAEDWLFWMLKHHFRMGIGNYNFQIRKHGTLLKLTPIIELPIKGAERCMYLRYREEGFNLLTQGETSELTMSEIEVDYCIPDWVKEEFSSIDGVLWNIISVSNSNMDRDSLEEFIDTLEIDNMQLGDDRHIIYSFLDAFLDQLGGGIYPDISKFEFPNSGIEDDFICKITCKGEEYTVIDIIRGEVILKNTKQENSENESNNPFSKVNLPDWCIEKKIGMKPSDEFNKLLFHPVGTSEFGEPTQVEYVDFSKAIQVLYKGMQKSPKLLEAIQMGFINNIRSAKTAAEIEGVVDWFSICNQVVSIGGKQYKYHVGKEGITICGMHVEVMTLKEKHQLDSKLDHLLRKESRDFEFIERLGLDNIESLEVFFTKLEGVVSSEIGRSMNSEDEIQVNSCEPYIEIVYFHKEGEEGILIEIEINYDDDLDYEIIVMEESDFRHTD